MTAYCVALQHYSDGGLNCGTDAAAIYAYANTIPFSRALFSFEKRIEFCPVAADAESADSADPGST